MPIFEIQGPDGQTYEVDAPDENSAVSAFQSQMSSPPDMSSSYNTQLTPEEESQFQQWAGPKIKDTYDYDLRGAWKAGAAESANGHLPDTFKKPNHPTFSVESQYSSSGTPGGQWVEGEGGNFSFRPSPYNLQNYGKDALSEYFRTNEPGVSLDIQQPEAVSPWAENVDALGRGIANGASFGFADNIGAAARWAGGKVLPWQENITYDQALQEVQGSDQSLAQANPVADTLGNVTGAVGTGVGLARNGATLAGRFGSDAATGVAGLLARGGLAGAEGAGYGALTALGNDQDVGTGALIGGGLGVAGSLAGDAIQGVVNSRAQSAMVPTIDDLKSQAGDLYKAAEARGVVADANSTKTLADSIKKIARDNELVTPKGRISEAYPRAKEAMALLDDYSGEVMNPTQMQVIRDTLADARNATQGKERRIASKMLEEFDNFTSPLAPELDEARKISQRYLKAGKLENMRELGDIRAGQFTNSGPENAMRTEYRQLDRAIAKGQEPGWSAAEREAISNVSRGTTGQTMARNVGKLAPTGPVSFMAGAGVPFMVGNAIGGPATGAASAGVASALGYGGKAVANAMQGRNIQIAELLARSGGQLPTVNNTGIRDAILRSLISGGTNQLAGQ